jgi:group I intron endonuclease
MIGIYKIVNIINNKIYIGSSNNIINRWKLHRRDLFKNKHDNFHLQFSWNKYGEDNFIFEIVEEVLDKTLLLEREQYYLDFYKSYEKEIGYNILKIAGNSLGFKHTEETKQKLSELNKGKKSIWYGKKHTEETKRKISESNMGKHISSEKERLRLSKLHKGKKLSQEQKDRMSESHKGEKNHFYGKRHSQETKEKISKNHCDVGGDNNPKSKLTWQQVREIRKKYNNNYKLIQLAKEYGVTSMNIKYIIQYKTWVEVE